MNPTSARKLLSVLALSILVGGGGVFARSSAAKTHGQSAGAQKSLTGIVTDSMCGATHMAKDKTPAECTRMCVKDGMKYALAVDKKLYTLQGHEEELAKLAGQKVTVTGAVNGDKVSVQSVAASK